MKEHIERINNLLNTQAESNDIQMIQSISKEVVKAFEEYQKELIKKMGYLYLEQYIDNIFNKGEKNDSLN